MSTSARAPPAAKRRRMSPSLASSPPSSLSPSAFVTCPVCSKPVAASFINSHLDSACGSESPAKKTQGVPPRGARPGPTTTTSATVSLRDSASLPSSRSSLSSSSTSPPTRREMAPKIVGDSPSRPLPPLAEQCRPRTLDELVGHEELIGEGTLLRRLIESDQLCSFILWAPPGVGKTTLASIIQRRTSHHFVSHSAVSLKVGDARTLLDKARNLRRGFGRRTCLFLDEIHRWTKAQQDQLLPAVEEGTVTLIGCTTENPSFHCNAALLSRCRVFKLEKLSTESIRRILERACTKLQPACTVEPDALDSLANLSDGDARAALNALEMAAAGCARDMVVSVETVKRALQKTHLHYDRDGEEHYNIISALHKSMRGGDANAALYWLGRMLEGGDEPLYIARRLVRFASEDVGLADPMALVLANAAFATCERIGMPECDVALAQCVAYLARAPKSVTVYKALGAIRKCIRNEPTLPVPLHIRNAPTSLMRGLGYGKGYIYTPEATDVEAARAQTYLPEALQGRVWLADEPE